MPSNPPLSVERIDSRQQWILYPRYLDSSLRFLHDTYGIVIEKKKDQRNRFRMLPISNMHWSRNLKAAEPMTVDDESTRKQHRGSYSILFFVIVEWSSALQLGAVIVSF